MVTYKGYRKIDCPNRFYMCNLEEDAEEVEDLTHLIIRKAVDNIFDKTETYHFFNSFINVSIINNRIMYIGEESLLTG